MIVTKTRKEMVEEYRARKGLLPFAIYQVEREDTDVADLLIERAVDKWYDELLASAPLRLLQVKDITAQVTARVGDDGSVNISLPDDFVRLVSVKMESWRVPATSLTDPDSFVGKMQLSPYIRGKSHSPVAMMYSPRELTLFSASGSSDQLARLLAVTRPAAGTYVFDQSALSSLPLIEV